MTARILNDYNVENGRITSPGKFEGEAAYVPYFWDMGLDGMADEDYTDSNGAVWAFDVTADDIAFFPELKNVNRVELRESDQGFVSAKLS